MDRALTSLLLFVALLASACSRRPGAAGVATDAREENAFAELAEGNLADSHVTVLVQSDGKLVMVGTAASAEGPRVLVERYLPAGRLDPAFGVGGRVEIS